MLLAGRLALAFGVRIVELLDTWDPWELTFWQAFEIAQGPIGYRRADELAAFSGYMSQRISDKAKPEDAFGILFHFLTELHKRPSDVFTDKELNETAEQRVDRLAQKVFQVFGLSEAELAKLFGKDEEE